MGHHYAMQHEKKNTLYVVELLIVNWIKLYTQTFPHLHTSLSFEQTIINSSFKYATDCIINYSIAGENYEYFRFIEFERISWMKNGKMYENVVQKLWEQKCVQSEILFE